MLLPSADFVLNEQQCSNYNANVIDYKKCLILKKSYTLEELKKKCRNDGNIYAASSVCHVRTEEISCNRCERTWLAAELPSSLWKQLRDQRQPEQSMSTVIGLTHHKSQLESGYSCALPESPQQQPSSVNCGFQPCTLQCLNFGLEVALIMKNDKLILTRGKLPIEKWSLVCCSSIKVLTTWFHLQACHHGLTDVWFNRTFQNWWGNSAKLDLIAPRGYKWCIAVNSIDYLGKLFHVCNCSRSQQNCSLFKDIH